MPSPWVRRMTQDTEPAATHASVANSGCNASTITFGGRCLSCGYNPNPQRGRFVAVKELGR